jgi:hypothetical protein
VISSLHATEETEVRELSISWSNIAKALGGSFEKIFLKHVPVQEWPVQHKNTLNICTCARMSDRMSLTFSSMSQTRVWNAL